MRYVRKSSDPIGQVMPLATWRIVSQGKQPRTESMGSLSPPCRRCPQFKYFPNIAPLMLNLTFVGFNVTELLNICVALFRVTMATIHSSMAVHPFVGPWHLLQFQYTDGKTPWTRDQPVARPLPTHRTAQTHI
jgi:hypothetical protein